MHGMLLTFMSVSINEAGVSIGKSQAQKGIINFYTLGFLNYFWGMIIFFSYALIREDFVFCLASLPTFCLRAVLEVLQAYLMVKAIILADRSTYGIFKIWTVPLLLLVDWMLKYSISSSHVIGIFLIMIGSVVFFSRKGISKKGIFYVIAGAINAVFTISLYKYNIEHFNSVPAEQGIKNIILIIYFFSMSRFKYKENPFKLLRNPILLLQSILMGIQMVPMGFAYKFAPASVITAAQKSFLVIISIISGKAVFKEKKFLLKLIIALVVIAGIIFIAIG